MNPLSASFRLILILSSLAIMPGCGDDSSGPDNTPDLSGSWTLGATLNNIELQTSCTVNGSVSINQSGTTFNGQVTGSTLECGGPGGTTSASADGAIVGGHINGNNVNYSDEECTYTGAASGSPPNTVAGDVSCSIAVGGTNYPFEGTWTISR